MPLWCNGSTDPFQGSSLGSEPGRGNIFCGISLVAELVLAKHRVTVRFCHTAAGQVAEWFKVTV